MSLALTGVDLSWDAARAVAHAAGHVLPARRLPLSDAVGTTLAEPVVALDDLPSADRSAMDGFAVRGAPPWTVIGELRAGDAPAPALLPGSAVAIATGVPVPAGADAVRDAIGPMLPGMIRWAGGTPTGTTLVCDSRDRLTEAITAADGQVVLVSGSSSAGAADHLRPCLAGLGADVLVDGVACRPGHPQSLAMLPDGRAVVGLPGNPLASLTAFLTLAVPLLAGLTGRPLTPLGHVAADGLTAHPTITRLVPVRLLDGAATAVQNAGSAMLRGVALADAIAVVPPGQASPVTVRLVPLLTGLPDQLRRAQRVFDRTGELHAAGLATADGQMLAVREDVGRHNAVDKVLGWALVNGRIPARGCVLVVSGRASFELVQKAVMAGVPVLAAVSAPSSLAVELAEEAGLTLAGFIRDGAMNVYSAAHRVSGSPEEVQVVS